MSTATLKHIRYVVSENPVTLFAFDRGQGLSEHTAPFDALVQVLAPTEKKNDEEEQ